MRRAFSEHWRGVAAGLLLLALGLLSIDVLFPTSWSRTDFVGAADEVFAHFPSTPAPPPPSLPLPEYREPANASIPAGGYEDQATAVVENPYGMAPEEPYVAPVMVWLTSLTFALVFVLPGVVAARIGPSVVAWRGALPGLIAAAFFASTITFRDPLEIALCIAPGLLTYAGGGLAKLLTWAPARPA